MKKIISSIMCLILLASTFVVSTISANAITPPASIPSNPSVPSSNNIGQKTNINYEYRIYYNNTIRIIKYTGSESEVVIPSQIDGKNVSCIGREAFKDCSFLTSVTIPNTVTSIQYLAFYRCKNLKQVNFSKTDSAISFIDDSAFDFHHSDMKFSYNCQQNKYIAKYTKKNKIFSTNDSHKFSTKYTVDLKPGYRYCGYKSHKCTLCGNADYYTKINRKKKPTAKPKVKRIENKGCKVYVTLKKKNKAYKSYVVRAYYKKGSPCYKSSKKSYIDITWSPKIKGKQVVFDLAGWGIASYEDLKYFKVYGVVHEDSHHKFRPYKEYLDIDNTASSNADSIIFDDDIVKCGSTKKIKAAVCKE